VADRKIRKRVKSWLGALVLRKKGTSYQDIAKAIDVSKATITNWFKEHDEAQKEREEAQKEAAV